MIAPVGYAGVVLGLAAAIALVITGIRRAQGASDSERPLRLAVGGVVAGALVAFGALELALLTNDFSVKYVAEHHSRSTPFLFTVATAWSALEGSIVLWVLVLAGYVAVVARQHRRHGHDPLGAGALAVMGGVAVFFFGLLATAANPFQTLATAPSDGPGPNPLLQNHILVAFHPPLLYLGYVGFTVPFAFAIAALARREPGPQWALRTRRWAMVAWVFLTAGIVLGAWWSYTVLGWGGYWGWDPVENASLLPWLLATAYLHSAIVQARRGMLRSWSTALVLGTFALTILGTFLTRSGVVESVHSFTQSAIGPALLGFLVLVTIGSFTLLASRSQLLAPDRPLRSLLSREGSFLVNNLLLTVFTFAVLLGTLYPIVVEAINGSQLSVGAPFFNTMAVPLSLGLLVAMGVGPLLPYGRDGARALWERVRFPLQLGLGAGVVAVLAGLHAPLVAFVLIVGVAIAAATLRTLARAVREESRRGQRRRALPTVLTRDPGYWCGQLAHLGVVLVAVGIASASGLSARAEVSLNRGQSVQFASYRVTYTGSFQEQQSNRTVSGAHVVVRGGGADHQLGPSLRYYPGQDQTVPSPAIWTTWRGDDVYVSLASLSGGRASFRLYHYPLVLLIWVGGLGTAGAGALSLVLRRRSRRGSASPTGAAVEVPVPGA